MPFDPVRPSPRSKLAAVLAACIAGCGAGAPSTQPGVSPPPPEGDSGGHPPPLEGDSGHRAERLTLRDGWLLQSSSAVQVDPGVISTTSFDATGWYPARVPSTVVGTLVEDGVYGDPLVGMNLRSLPGMSYGVGEIFTDYEMQDDSPFAVSWWYRTTFALPADDAGRKIWLDLDGVNYRAGVWLNGRQVATSQDVAGTYASFELDVSDAARPGEANVLAIEVSAPRVHDLAHTWVDWNPMPPDKNMGLWRDVWLSSSGPIALRHPQVRTRLDLPSLDVAHLEISAELRNTTGAPFAGQLHATIGDIAVTAPVALDAHENRTVTLTSARYPQLDVKSPALWWPAQYGAPTLHTLTLEVEAGGVVSDRSSVRFGMREVTSELTAEGHRLFSVNGERILVRGAGWARNIFFMETAGREDREMSLVRDLGLNAVRFEGKFGSEHLLDLADELGILVIPGWSCCDFWERTPEWGPDQYAVAESSMRNMALRLRNRPSVLTWLYGSDVPPVAEVESLYLRVLSASNWPNPCQSSAGSTPTAVTGATGLKMEGPYQWVPPVYWLGDGDPGAASGFATEISPGPAVPEVESLRAMLGPDHLWPIDDVWNFHAGSGGFRDIDVFTAALQGRYGDATDVDDYARKAQAMTYEAQRAMFEAYGRRKYLATGVIQWMLNNAWPSLIWHLYDYDLTAGGGYYGTKKALEPLHVQYAWADGAVTVVNSTLDAYPGLSVRARVLDLDLTERYADEAQLDAAPDSSTDVLVLPQGLTASTTYLVDLELLAADGSVASSNLYWLSATPDVLDPTLADPVLAYADLTALADLESVGLVVSSTLPVGDREKTVVVTVTNPGPGLAFMIRLALTKGDGGPELLPTRWDDNFFSLFPGQSRTVMARYLDEDAEGVQPAVRARGWNVSP